jgi:hypothetical protein
MLPLNQQCDKNSITSTIMFKNYLKTAVRNLLRYKGFTLLIS